VCGALFVLRESGRGTLVEAEAAHIIPVRENGPDDPRNGMSLCPRHHWAFDAGLFTVTAGFLVRLSPAVARAERRKFDLEEYDGEPISRPVRESCVPDSRALEWHQDRVFRAA
jgi:putative restriction endonuclease